MCMFPACCFPHRIFVAQDQMNETLYEILTHLYRFVSRISLLDPESMRLMKCYFLDSAVTRPICLPHMETTINIYQSNRRFLQTEKLHTQNIIQQLKKMYNVNTFGTSKIKPKITWKVKKNHKLTTAQKHCNLYIDKWKTNSHLPQTTFEIKHKLLWGFLDQTTRSYNNQRKKRICGIVGFVVSADHRVKLKECGERDKYLDLSRDLKNLWNMKVPIIPIVIGALGKVTNRLIKGVGNNWTCRDHPNYSIIEISQNTEKSPGDLLSLKLQRETIS